MNVSTTATELVVHKELFVKAPPSLAFEVFTKRISEWWPLATHKIGKADAKEAVIEPTIGGRWFERGVDGSECDWGHVIAWEPPSRLVLSWEINANWQPDSTARSEVEVCFSPAEGGTLVKFVHRKLEAFGPRAEEMQKTLGGGWSSLLAAFVARAER